MAGAHVVGAVVVMSEGMARLRRGIAVMQCTRRRHGGSVWVGKHYEWTASTPMHLLAGISRPPDVFGEIANLVPDTWEWGGQHVCARGRSKFRVNRHASNHMQITDPSG